MQICILLAANNTCSHDIHSFSVTLKRRHTSFSKFFSILTWCSEFPSRVIVGIKDTRGTREFVISPYFAKSSFPLPAFKHFFMDSRSTDIRSAHVFIIRIGSMLFSIMQPANCSCTDEFLMTSMEQACIMFAWHSTGPCWHTNWYPSLVFAVFALPYGTSSSSMFAKSFRYVGPNCFKMKLRESGHNAS